MYEIDISNTISVLTTVVFLIIVCMKYFNHERHLGPLTEVFIYFILIRTAIFMIMSIDYGIEKLLNRL